MSKRLKNNISAALVLIILAVLVVVSLTTIYTSVSLLELSGEHASADTWRINDYGKAAANETQEFVNQQRAKIYNSSNVVVNFVANLDDGVQETVALLFIFSPFIWIFVVRFYNTKKRKKRKARRVVVQNARI